MARSETACLISDMLSTSDFAAFVISVASALIASVLVLISPVKPVTASSIVLNAATSAVAASEAA